MQPRILHYWLFAGQAIVCAGLAVAAYFFSPWYWAAFATVLCVANMCNALGVGIDYKKAKEATR